MSDGAGRVAARWVRSLEAVAAAVVMLPLALAPAVTAVALAVTFAWLPGALAVDLLRTSADPGERTLATLALSPALVGGAAALLIAAGVHPVLAARFLAALLFIGAVARAMWPRDLSGPVSSDPSGTTPTRFAPALVWALVVAAFLIANPFLPPRSDGWFHAAVTRQIALRGLPVEDPSFAGLRLPYFWGTNLWAALWIARAPRLAVWIPLVALNLSAAVAVILAVCALARRLGANRGGQWAAATLAVLGVSPFAWGWVAARAATGEVRGFAELQRLAGSGVDVALRALTVGQLHPSLAGFADKFLVLTPFGLGLALFALMVLALRDAADQGSPGSLVALALVSAAALFTHTFAGMSALAFAAAWWLASLARGAPGRARLVAIAAALAGGAAIVTPYLLNISRGSTTTMSIGFSKLAFGTLLLGGALLVPAGLIGLARLRAVRPIAGDLLIAMAVLAALGLLVELPGRNESKYFNLLFLIAAPAAACAILAWSARWSPGARGALALGIAAATIPTAAICAWGYLSERGQAADSWRAPSPAVASAWRWLNENTRAECVVADEGGAREAMVLAARSALAPGASFERKWGYPPPATAIRRRANRELAARGPISAASDSLLRSLGREIVVVERRAGAPGDAEWRDAGADTGAAPTGSERRPRYVLLRDSGPIAFWRVELAR